VSGATTTYKQYNADLSNYSNIKIKLIDGRGSGAHERYVDDFSVTVKPIGPSISIPTLTGTSPYCESSTFNVSYSTTGTFNAGNTFTAQLSDATGDFSA